MNERDRLIELIQGAVDGCARHWAEIIADYLLANGVIVPPVRIGQTVYAVVYDLHGDVIVHECQVVEMKVRYSGMTFSCIGGFVFGLEHLGETVFLTREEAEKALKERIEKMT